jgi:2-dehydropantoate 2-reductase
LSRRVVALVKAAEASGKGSPGLTVEQIRPSNSMIDV